MLKSSLVSSVANLSIVWRSISPVRRSSTRRRHAVPLRRRTRRPFVSREPDCRTTNGPTRRSVRAASCGGLVALRASTLAISSPTLPLAAFCSTSTQVQPNHRRHSRLMLVLVSMRWRSIHCSHTCTVRVHAIHRCLATNCFPKSIWLRLVIRRKTFVFMARRN